MRRDSQNHRSDHVHLKLMRNDTPKSAACSLQDPKVADDAPDKKIKKLGPLFARINVSVSTGISTP